MFLKSKQSLFGMSKNVCTRHKLQLFVDTLLKSGQVNRGIWIIFVKGRTVRRAFGKFEFGRFLSQAYPINVYLSKVLDLEILTLHSSKNSNKALRACHKAGWGCSWNSPTNSIFLIGKLPIGCFSCLYCSFKNWHLVA
jgi:hypothetical protein